VLGGFSAKLEMNLEEAGRPMAVFATGKNAESILK